jgi:hypothetical protein
MENFEGAFIGLKEQILMERRSKGAQAGYSQELQLAVVELVRKVGNRALCAKRLGLATSLIYKWNLKNNSNIPPPRRLIVAPNNEEKMANVCSEMKPVQYFEAVLANGIVIKCLPLTAEALQLLGGVK